MYDYQLQYKSRAKETPVLCYSQNQHVQVLSSDINFELHVQM